MKSTFTPNESKSERKYPCFLRGLNTGRIVLALDNDTDIVLVGGPEVLQLATSDDCYSESCWSPVEGTITIELP